MVINGLSMAEAKRWQPRKNTRPLSLGSSGTGSDIIPGASTMTSVYKVTESQLSRELAQHLHRTSSPPSQISIIVARVQGPPLQLQGTTHTRVREVKTVIQQGLGSVQPLQLTWQGITLVDDMTLQDYGIVSSPAVFKLTDSEDRLTSRGSAELYSTPATLAHPGGVFNRRALAVYSFRHQQGAFALLLIVRSRP